MPRPDWKAPTKVEELTYKAGAIWGGYLMPWDKWVYGITIGQQYLMENTTLGIPGIVQSEGASYSTPPMSDILICMV